MLDIIKKSILLLYFKFYKNIQNLFYFYLFSLGIFLIQTPSESPSSSEEGELSFVFFVVSCSFYINIEIPASPNNTEIPTWNMRSESFT